ncbi:MAG: ribbon-helix-helix protein, CopG family [Candidatus Micrarchaeaceae archaeon]
MQKVKYNKKLMIWISEKQSKKIERIANYMGRTKSDIIRQALSEFIENFKKNKSQIARNKDE